MQQSLLFQNIYNFLKKDQIFEVNIEPTPHFFEQKWGVQLRVSPIKEIQLHFITLTITIHPSLLFTGFFVLSWLSAISQDGFL